MSFSKDFLDILDYCVDIANENIDVLSDIRYFLGTESEENLSQIENKTQLIDMAYEVSDSQKLRNAESSFFQRHIEKKSN